MNYEKNVVLKEKSQAELTVKIKNSDVDTRYQDLLKKYSKELQIPGFRKGKAPASVLEKKYGEAIRGDLAGDLIEESLKEIFDSLDDSEKPLQYMYPELQGKPELKLGQDFEFTVLYDVFPKIDIKRKEGFEIEIPQVSISDADMQDELKKVQERNALVSSCKEGTKAEKDHIATINYSELDDDGKTIDGTRREDFVFTIGTKQNIFELDDDILGMKVGETKEVSKEFPKDHGNPELAGKTKKIQVELKELKSRDLPAIDDDLAQDVSEKYKTLDDLKADIKKNLQNSIDTKIKKLKEKAVIDQILAETTIDLPESMVQAELETRWMMMANQFRMSPEELDKLFAKQPGGDKESLFKSWREDSEKNLKASLVVEILTKDSNIEVSADEIEAAYKKIADEHNITVEEVKKHYADQRQESYFTEGVKQEKLFDSIYEKSKISNGRKMSLTEFFEEKGETA